jgi:hypothetical protein
MSHNEEFVWIRNEGDMRSGGLMRVYFGKSHDDPIPFILTVMPSYVARKTQKTLPLTIQELQNYCDDHREDLRQIALGCKQRVLNAETLT